jgi:hypothetical protein
LLSFRSTCRAKEACVVASLREKPNGCYCRRARHQGLPQGDPHPARSAASIAKAANACAEAGNADKGVHVALDIEQLCYEATRLLDAASLINRLTKEE